MVENLASRKAQVCDSRGPGMFNHSPEGKLRGTMSFNKQTIEGEDRHAPIVIAEI